MSNPTNGPGLAGRRALQRWLGPWVAEVNTATLRSDALAALLAAVLVLPQGIAFAALRYCPVAGPWSGPGGGGPSGIFRAMLEAAVDGREAVIPGTAMEWVYSKDAAMATVQALQAPDLGRGVFNITMGRIYRPEELAAELQRAFPGVRTRIEAQPEGSTWSGGDWKPADLARAAKHLGYVPQYPMARLLEDYAQWYRALRGR
jgi:nucleoside-diphosphate-sugar epimerase